MRRPSEQRYRLPHRLDRYLRDLLVSCGVLQVPAPVIAGALGFHHTTTTRQHINAGATWSQYAANRDRD